MLAHYVAPVCASLVYTACGIHQNTSPIQGDPDRALYKLRDRDSLLD